jgi:hypothetical protein
MCNLNTRICFYMICGHLWSFFVGFEVFTVAGMKMAIFWVIALCSLVEVYQCFSGACCLHIALILEGAGTTRMSLNSYQMTWH